MWGMGIIQGSTLQRTSSSAFSKSSGKPVGRLPSRIWVLTIWFKLGEVEAHDT